MDKPQLGIWIGVSHTIGKINFSGLFSDSGVPISYRNVQ